MNTPPRFVQIHSLHSWPAALLNRDDTGLAKRLSYGGHSRTRVSSQCLKRHWRTADSVDAFDRIEGYVESVRSREVVNRRVIAPALAASDSDEKVAKALADSFNKGVYGDKGAERKARQPLLLGAPEIDYLREQAGRLLGEHPHDAKALAAAIAAFFKDNKHNLGALRESARLPGGLAAALFGRMVTADPAANIDAAIHVAHAFTVHAEESESDYFAVVDDLAADDDEAGADHIGDSELTAGLFYGYVVVDVPALVSNIEGVAADDWLAADTDRRLSAQIVRRLVHLIATVSPGAKRGSTAPYSWAQWLLVETGDRQPRSLADAFRDPVGARLGDALAASREQLERLDGCYGAGETRRFLCTDPDATLPGAERLSLGELAAQLAADIDAATA